MLKSVPGKLNAEISGWYIQLNTMKLNRKMCTVL